MRYRLLVLLFLAAGLSAPAQSFRTLSGTAVEVSVRGREKLYVDFYGPRIFRLYTGSAAPAPLNADPPAEILVEDARKPSGEIRTNPAGTVTNGTLTLQFDRKDGSFTVHDNGRALLPRTEWAPDRITVQADAQAPFFGGGVQNGRFSHRGTAISIENQNSWTDGGVASPVPFAWTPGYGLLWHTFKPGKYDFTAADKVTFSHETDHLDVFFILEDTPEGILKGYFQLTGKPVLLPKFAFYEGHLNAYNRDYWTPVEEGGVPFEDGKRYKESQKDNGGIRESLNGELPGNYPFSARAVIDRYAAADMPLGWILPNDGYGAGYGQTETLDGNVQNLKEFGNFARSRGVEIGLWTQSDLHPVDTLPALLQRDIDKEVGDAGVRVLKTDVAWVGEGYSFGLNGVADAAGIMSAHGVRPFIITLDGWAGTQRFAGVWTGDQTGGQWEYIRFHIPTYIGAGLSGLSNITSDMDGIFGGRNEPVNIRDFQWKAFTPMQMNMDGWGANEKYPQALGERAAQINRKYLKLKSSLLPYTYSVAREAVEGLPLVRAMFLSDPSAYTYGTATRYQFLYGPSFLVAPVYRETAADPYGNDLRCGIWLPEGRWYDWFSGEAYDGGVILDDFPAPLDKLPVFVKEGAIIPMTAPHNNPSQMEKDVRRYEVFPLRAGTSGFTEYDDDGRTEAYLRGAFATTQLTCTTSDRGEVSFTIGAAQGGFDGMLREKETVIRFHTAREPKKVRVNGRRTEYVHADGILTVTVPRGDILRETVIVFDRFDPAPPALKATRKGHLVKPAVETEATAYTVTLRWDPAPEADWYEVLYGGMTHTGLRRGLFVCEDLEPGALCSFRVRGVNANGPGRWADVAVRTAKDPYENAIKGITATCTAPDQPGQEIANLFDGSVKTEMWHTEWGKRSTPFDITADLGAVYTLEKLEYVPRSDAGNGTLYIGTVSTSQDGKAWSEPSRFQWERDAQSKFFDLRGVQARFVKVSVQSGTGGFGSGRELYVYKVPGTGSFRLGVFNEKGEAVEKID